jgi:hypothetical protein
MQNLSFNAGQAHAHLGIHVVRDAVNLHASALPLRAC